MQISISCKTVSCFSSPTVGDVKMFGKTGYDRESRGAEYMGHYSKTQRCDREIYTGVNNGVLCLWRVPLPAVHAVARV